MNCRGFTLLELMVAVAIFAVIASLGFGALTQISRNQGELLTRAEYTRQLARAVQLLDGELRLAVPRSARDPLGQRTPALSLQSERLQLTALGSEGAAPRRVEYVVVGDQLLRRSWQPADGASTPAASVLLDGVSAVRFQAMDNAQWVDRWPTEEAVWPRALRVVAEVDGFGRLERVVRLVEHSAHGL